MGWLFGRKKKVPVVPLPEGKLIDEKTLKFPSSKVSSEKMIEPEKVKEAAGLSKPIAFPDQKEVPNQFMTANTGEEDTTISRFSYSEEPYYVKVDVYQRMLGSIEEAKDNFRDLNEASKKLENSEFNEEKNFDKLKKAVKNLHDRLLLMDKTIFKS